LKSKGLISDESALGTMLGTQKSETKKKEPYTLGTFVMADIKRVRKEEPCRILSFEEKNKGYEYLVDNSEGRYGKVSGEMKTADGGQEKQWIKERHNLFSGNVRPAHAASYHVKLFTEPPTIDNLLDNMCEGLDKVDEKNRIRYRDVLVESIKGSDKFLINEEAGTISLKPDGSSRKTTSACAQSTGMDADKASSAVSQSITEKTETARPPANGNSSSASNGTQQEKRHDADPFQGVDIESIKSTAYDKGYDAAKESHKEAIKKKGVEAHKVGYEEAKTEHAEGATKRKNDAKALVKSWQTTRSYTTNIPLANQFNAVITPAPADPDAAKIISNFLQTSTNDSKSEHPLFCMIDAAKTQEQRRYLISLLDLDTLKAFMEWLDRSQRDLSRVLISGLSELLSRLYDTSTKPNEYQRLCEMMARLIKKLPEQDQEPYYWRLFSFVRESWSHLAPKANKGDNDTEAVTGFLEWLPSFAVSMPDTLRTTLLVSLMLDETFVKVYDSIRKSVLELCVKHVLTAEPSERRLRLNFLLNLLPASAEGEFLDLYSYDLTR